jgi:hypothetical protein
MSALPPKADIGTQPRHVRFVPKADIQPRIRDVRFVPVADIAAYLHALNCSKSKRAPPEWAIHRWNRKNRMTDDWKKTVHRNKLLGLWAAEKLGITGQDAEDYSDALAAGTLDPERSDVLSKIRKDFDAAGVVQSGRADPTRHERTHAPSREPNAGNARRRVGCFDSTARAQTRRNEQTSCKHQVTAPAAAKDRA